MRATLTVRGSYAAGYGRRDRDYSLSRWYEADGCYWISTNGPADDIGPFSSALAALAWGRSNGKVYVHER